MPEANGSPLGDDGLLEAASRLIEAGRTAIAYHVNSVQVAANWRLGKLIDQEILNRGRADYGIQIQATLSPELSWSHIRELLPLKTQEARCFYAAEVSAKHLGVRELRYAISRKAFERREIANSQIPDGSAVPLDVFRDPMLLDMLGLKEAYQERDLESAIIRELEPFLLETGKGWSFVARQKRMTMDDDDFWLDLLFFSRPLRRLIAVELKLGKFKPAYKGQMDFYLKWLNRFERQPDEEAPIGLILCTEASRDQIELLELHRDNIVAAEYWTDLLPRDELERRLAVILREAKERLARRALPFNATDEDDKSR